MRLYSLLFVTLFACFHTSSARSISTSVGLLRSNKVDDSAYLVEVETTKEERAFNFPSLDQSIEKVNSMASEGVEKMLYWVLRLSGKDGMEAYEFLRLDNDNSIRLRNIRFKAWVRYLKRAPLETEEATTKMLTRRGDESVVQMLDALKKANVREDIQVKLKAALMAFWKNEAKSSKEVFKVLKLDAAVPNPLLTLERLEMWFKHTNEMNTKPDEMLSMISDLDVDVQVMITRALTQIDGTENVVSSIQDSLLTFWDNNKPSVMEVFTTLHLGTNYNKFVFDMWLKYFLKASEFTKLQPVEDVMKQLLRRQNDEGLLKMLEALKKANVREDLQIKVKTALLWSWHDQNKKPEKLFKQLNLDDMDHSLDVERFEMWMQYMRDNHDVALAFKSYDFDFVKRMRILDGLRQIKDTESIEIMENMLVESLPNREGSIDVRILEAFRELKLDKDLENLLRHPNLKIFNEYAAKFEPEVSREKTLITASREVYGDKPLSEMLDASVKDNNAEAEHLLEELFRQWFSETIRGDPDIAKILGDELRKSYDAYVLKLGYVRTNKR